LEKYSESSSSVAERNALRKMVLLRLSACGVGAGSVPGGAVGGARFGVLRYVLKNMFNVYLHLQMCTSTSR
jgi:hypothetical protein